MPRFKTPEYGLKFVPIDFSQQIVRDSFEHALCVLIDGGELDLSAPAARVRNEACAAPAYHTLGCC